MLPATDCPECPKVPQLRRTPLSTNRLPIFLGVSHELNMAIALRPATAGQNSQEMGRRLVESGVRRSWGTFGHSGNRLQAAMANFPAGRSAAFSIGSPHTIPPAARQGCAGYNRVVRTGCVAFLMVCLAGCNRGVQNKDAVRQGVLDHLAQVPMNVASMNVEVTSVQFKRQPGGCDGVVFIPRAATRRRNVDAVSTRTEGWPLGGDGPQGCGFQSAWRRGDAPGGARCGESA